MSPRSANCRLLLICTALAGWAAASPAASAPGARSLPGRPATATQGAATLKDRVLAVVDEDPILASDLSRTLALGAETPRPGESDHAFRRRVLDELVAERLRFHEIDRYGSEQVPVDQIDKNVQEIRARFKDEAAFRQKLKDLGLDLAALRLLVARQLEVLAYVDERLGPRVFVSLEDINSYYHATLIPEMQRKRLPVPPIEDVREQIRNVLRQQRLTDEVNRWTEELRRSANIAIYLDQPIGPLPPVVKRITTPPPPPGTPRPPTRPPS